MVKHTATSTNGKIHFYLISFLIFEQKHFHLQVIKYYCSFCNIHFDFSLVMILKQKNIHFLVAMDREQELTNNMIRANNEIETIHFLLSQARQQGRSQATIDNLSRELRDAEVELIEAMRALHEELDLQNQRMEFALQQLDAKKNNA